MTGEKAKSIWIVDTFILDTSGGVMDRHTMLVRASTKAGAVKKACSCRKADIHEMADLMGNGHKIINAD